MSAQSTEELSDSDKESVKAKIRKILTADKHTSESKERKANYIAIKLPTDQYNHFFPDIPEDEAGEITIEALERHIEWLSEQGNEDESA